MRPMAIRMTTPISNPLRRASAKRRPGRLTEGSLHLPCIPHPASQDPSLTPAGGCIMGLHKPLASGCVMGLAYPAVKLPGSREARSPPTQAPTWAVLCPAYPSPSAERWSSSSPLSRPESQTSSWEALPFHRRRPYRSFRRYL